MAVQYAAKLGMTVTAFSSTPDKKDFVNSLGATHVTSSVDLKSLKEHEGKFDLVLNTLHVTQHDTLIVKLYFNERPTNVSLSSEDPMFN